MMKTIDEQLRVAIDKSNLVEVNNLLNNKADINLIGHYGRAPFYFAMEKKNIPIIKCLIERTADINYAGCFDSPPIHMAAQSVNLDLIELLLSNKANVNSVSVDQNPLLQHAVINNKTTIVRLLIENNACVNDYDKFSRQSFLHMAAKCENSLIVKLLLDSGANRMFRDQTGERPIDMTKQSNIRQILLTYPSPSWTPNIHLNMSSLAQRQKIKTLFILRNINPILLNIPNELMFLIVSHLF